MSVNRSACIMSTWTAGDLTITTKGAEVYGVVCLGSAEASTLTIKDSATTKIVVAISTTASVSINLCTPVAFSTSIVADMTGTASYSVLYANRG